MTERPRLDSWKEIAQYLRRDVRTVIRWEKDRGLPVYRLPGGKLSRVFAYPEELDGWLERGTPEGEAGEQPSPPPPPSPPAPVPRARPRLLVAAAILGILLVTGASTAWTVRLRHAARQLTLSGEELRALDAEGQARWSYRIDGALLSPGAAHWNHVGDLDNDRMVDLLAAVQVAIPSSNLQAGRLVNFDSAGTLRWSASLDDTLAFRDGNYGPPWPSAALAVYSTGGERRIAWALHHFTWWPSVLVTLDGRGQRTGTFVNSGWITSVVPSRDGRFLFLGGVTNAHGAYFLAVLDAASPTGSSPEPAGSFTECLSCPSGSPLHYFVLPRADVGQAQPFPASGPTIEAFEDGRLQVDVLQSGGPNIAAAIFEFTPGFDLPAARFSDSFWEWHQRLERAGQLDHSAADCPERKGLALKRWTPAGGWQAVTVAAR